MQKKLIVLAFCWQAVLAAAYGADDDERYAEALKAARGGRPRQALPIFEALMRAHPEIERYRYDYLACLAWAGQDAEVLRQSRGLDPAAAPVYVLEAVAGAARGTGDYDQAYRLFRMASSKAPARLAPRLGMALALMDQGRAEAALAALRPLAARYPGNIDIVLAQAYAYEQAGDLPAAVASYRRALRLRPDSEEARRGLILALNNLQPGPETMAQAEAGRRLFSADQWAAIRWNYAAWQVRRGEDALGGNPRDFRPVDQAIASLIDNIHLTYRLPLSDRQSWRTRAEFDLMAALRDRKRMRDVITVYRQLRRRNAPMPVYARMAAADALLNNRQPDEARDLYRSVLNEKPDYFNAKASLVYAYLECEQPDQALAAADELAAGQPPLISEKRPDGAWLRRPNPQKQSAELIAAMMRAYRDDLGDAQRRLRFLHARYPDNIGIYAKLAEVDYFRGWPRQADRRLQQALIEAPGDWGVQLVRAKVLRDLRQYRQEEALTYDLYALYPEDSGIRKQRRLWRIHNDRELKIYADGGVSQNALRNQANPVFGSDEINLDSYLYSGPIAYNYRAFVHNGWKTGLFTEGRGYLRHYGAGIEYSRPNLIADAEFHYDNFRRDAVGVDVNADYQFTDRWDVFGRFSSLDNTISLRALKSGVTARSVQVGGRYRAHESMYVSAAGRFVDFSDGNARFAGDAAYFQRWHSGPVYKFGTFVNTGFSANSSSEGAYYSPGRDAYLTVTFDNDFLTYRHYETAFHQRLALTVGNYWQSNDAPGPACAQSACSNIIGNIQYEHRWQAANRFELIYGGVRRYQFYDDALTKTWYFYLIADLRF